MEVNLPFLILTEDLFAVEKPAHSMCVHMFVAQII